MGKEPVCIGGGGGGGGAGVLHGRGGPKQDYIIMSNKDRMHTF